MHPEVLLISVVALVRMRSMGSMNPVDSGRVLASSRTGLGDAFDASRLGQ